MNRHEYMAEQRKAIRDNPCPARKPSLYNGVEYDSNHEFRWAQALATLGIDFLAGPIIDELKDGLGAWKPDLAVPRAGGGFVWVEVKPFKADGSMFDAVRSKMESAKNDKIDPDTDALLFLDTFPAAARPFGLAATNFDRSGKREWLWDAVWYWRQTPTGRAGLRMGRGGDLLLDDSDSTIALDAAMGLLTDEIEPWWPWEGH